MINNKICFYIISAFVLCGGQSADAAAWLNGCTESKYCTCGNRMVGATQNKYCCPETKTSTTITCPSGWTKETYSGIQIPEAPTKYVCTRADETTYNALSHSYVKTTYSTCWAESTTTTETRYCPTTTDSCGLKLDCKLGDSPILDL
ncbi:MAG TPA: hypothetical protein DEA31_02810 [Alphaproteobacteria bacterium]|nr:hypothetical protein [Alphaproteobacteria bacterium]